MDLINRINYSRFFGREFLTWLWFHSDRNEGIFQQGSDKGPIEVTATRELYRYRPTEAYGAIGRLASPWIGDPTTTTYQAKAAISGGTTVSGILEVLDIDAPGCVGQ